MSYPTLFPTSEYLSHNEPTWLFNSSHNYILLICSEAYYVYNEHSMSFLLLGTLTNMPHPRLTDNGPTVESTKKCDPYSG